MYNVVVDGFLIKDCEANFYENTSLLKGCVSVSSPTGKKDDDGKPLYESVLKNFSYWTDNADKMVDEWTKGKKVFLTGSIQLFRKDESTVYETIMVNKGQAFIDPYYVKPAKATAKKIKMVRQEISEDDCE